MKSDPNTRKIKDSDSKDKHTKKQTCESDKDSKIEDKGKAREDEGTKTETNRPVSMTDRTQEI